MAFGCIPCITWQDICNYIQRFWLNKVFFSFFLKKKRFFWWQQSRNKEERFSIKDHDMSPTKQSAEAQGWFLPVLYHPKSIIITDNPEHFHSVCLYTLKSPSKFQKRIESHILTPSLSSFHHSNTDTRPYSTFALAVLVENIPWNYISPSLNLNIPRITAGIFLFTVRFIISSVLKYTMSSRWIILWMFFGKRSERRYCYYISLVPPWPREERILLNSYSWLSMCFMKLQRFSRLWWSPVSEPLKEN